MTFESLMPKPFCMDKTSVFKGFTVISVGFSVGIR